jgi:hypothetical protein
MLVRARDGLPAQLSTGQCIVMSGVVVAYRRGTDMRRSLDP